MSYCSADCPHVPSLSLDREPSATFFLFFNDTATTEIYTLSLHDALPLYVTVGPDHDVLRLQVAMNNSVGVGHGQAFGHLRGDVENVAGGQMATQHFGPQR